MIKKTEELEKTIKITFTDKTLLKNVFIHRSYLNENKYSKLPSNEKLEFLGDSVLSLITSIYLYKNYPELQEGEYTDIKATVVKTQSLGEASARIDLGGHLYLSKGEELGGGRTNVNILADCFEALIAAIFIDQGFDKAYDFVLQYLFSKKLEYVIKNKLYLSGKSKLQELSQAKHKVLPTYKILEEQGPEHKRTFTVLVSVKDKKLGIGSGHSKKEAEESAAQKALEKIR